MKTLFFAILATLCLASCNLGLTNRKPDSTLNQFARQYLHTLRSADLYSCQKMSGDALASDAGKQLLASYYNFLSRLNIDSFELISTKDSVLLNKKQASINIVILTYEAKTDQGFLVFEIGLSNYDNGTFTETIRFGCSPISLKQSNKLSFSSKAIGYYAFMVLMVAMFLFVLISSIFIFKTDFSNKWLWLLGCWLGLFGISLNWASGELNIQLFLIQLGSIGYYKDLPFGPSRLAVSLPAVAIWFWIERRRMKIDNDLLES